MKSYKGHSADVIDCQANADSSQFVSCSNDKSLIVWEVESGKILRRFRNLAPFNSVCYGHEANTALAGSLDGTLKIYDLRALNAWEPIQTLGEASDSVSCKVHEHLIFSTSLDKKLRTYDIRKGILSVDTFHAPLNYISPSRNASSLLVTCLRSSTLLVDRTEGQLLNEFKGNENKLFKLESTFLLNDCSVAAGSEDGNVYIWDTVEVGKQPKIALVHPNLITPVIQSISSDSLDYLLTTAGSSMFMWSL